MKSGVQARFFCKTGELAGSEYWICDDATIGRGLHNSIVLAADVVSKAHARIVFDPVATAWFLEDLDSTNGTRLDGCPVSGRERLGKLHVVTFGERHDFVFVVPPDEAQRSGTAPHEGVPALPVEPATRYDSPAMLDVPALSAEPESGEADQVEPAQVETTAPGAGREPAVSPPEPETRYEPPATLDVPPLQGDPAPPSGTAIEIRTADGEPRRMLLGEGRHVLGRAKDCAVRIDDATLSRRHAAIIVHGDHVAVIDLGSLNGTFIDEAPVESATEIGVGQTVTLGDSVQVVQIASGALMLDGGSEG